MTTGSLINPADLSAVTSASLAADPNQAARQAKAAEEAKLKAACRSFESMFLNQMFKSMRETVPKGMMHAGHAEDLFTGMLDQAIADSATQSRSMGLADMLERQLTQARSTRPEVQGTVQTSAASRAYSQAAATAYSPAAATDEPAMAAPVAGQVSSTFGPRIHPIKGHAQNHSGLDLAAAEGTPIRAALEGKVVFARERGGYGNLVILEHPDGRQTYYGHCAELKVTEGQTVDQGQLIATVGATGLATGPHLHFEVRESSGQAIDPLPLVAQDLGLTATA